MVSKLYDADEFFKKQSAGKLAKGYNYNKKLHLDSQGYHLYKKDKNGDFYRQDVNPKDKVYSRQEGVTVYSKARDRDKIEVRHKKETPKQHESKAHMYDRKGGKTNFKI